MKLESADFLDITFGQTGNCTMFVDKGWYGAEQEFRWTSGDTSTLTLKAPFGAEIVGVELDVSPMLFPAPNAGSQTFRVSVCNRIVLLHKLERRDRIRTAITGLIVSARQTIKIEIFHPFAIRPSDIKDGSGDSRQLSLALRNFRLFYQPIGVLVEEILLAAFGRRRTLSDRAAARMWANDQPARDVYCIEVSKESLPTVVACCSPIIAFSPDGFSVKPGESATFYVPLNCLGGTATVRLAIQTSNGDTSRLAALLTPAIGGRILALKESDEPDTVVFEIEGVRYTNKMQVRLAALVDGDKASLQIRKAILTFVNEGARLNADDEVAFWELFDRIDRPETASSAKSLLTMFGNSLPDIGRALTALTRLAKSECDSRGELRALQELFLRGLSDGVALATCGRSQARPIAHAALLEQVLPTRQNPVSAFYEIGNSYRGIGWFHRAVQAFRHVPDPHPHWGGVILWTERRLSDTRRAAMALLQLRRQGGRSLTMQQARDLCGYLISLSRSRCARSIMDDYAALAPNDWLAVRARIDLFDGKAVELASVASRVCLSPESDASDLVAHGDYDRWAMMEVGHYDLAAAGLLEDYNRSGHVEALANATMASCLSGNTERVADAWRGVQHSALMSLYDAQMFVSLAVTDKIVTSVSLINRDLGSPIDSVSSGDRNIIQFWNDDQPPNDVRECILSWSERNTSYRHILFSDTSAHSFIHQNYGARFAACFEMCHHPAMRSDYLRMLALHHFGGIYFDADLVCRASLDQTRMRMVVGQRGIIALPLVPSLPYAINNDVIGASKGSPFMMYVAELASTLIEKDVNAGITSDVGQVTGPGLYTRVVATALQQRLRSEASAMGSEHFVLVPFPYRESVLKSRGDLDYFRSRDHWSVAQNRARQAPAR